MRNIWTGAMFLIVLLALFYTNARAGEVYVNGALGFLDNARPGPVDVKYGEAGYCSYLGPFFNQTSGGGWVQVQENDGRKSSAFVSDQVGIEADDGLVLRISTGPSIISTPDSYLGGHFQFHESAYVGIRDSVYGNSIGVVYQHFSSAGIEMPNYGRDFAGVQISF